MKKLKMPVILSALFFLLSCGIEEYYYLPQVHQDDIISNLTNSATINLPPINSVQFYYATNYSIFYRIYISETPLTSVQTINDMTNINPDLARDYNSLLSYTDTAGTIITKDTFPALKYYEIELDGAKIADIFSKNGGTLEIVFSTSTGYPTVSLDNGSAFRLRRSGNLISPVPSDRFFRNTEELNDNDNATDEKNADVARRTTGFDQRYTYVSMYIVATGVNPDTFTRMYSKPTHINIFRLPD